MEQQKPKTTEPLLHTISDSQTKTSTNMTIKTASFFFVGSIVLGIIAGYGITSFKGSTATSDTPSTAKTAEGTTGDVKKTVGIVDKKEFPDNAEGTLKEGGLEGEGTFHLERPGGESQNVYLTSSTVDMSPLVGKKVRVWGQTFSGQKAGWLMDVGLVEVLN